jgi:preprotein translocase subunit SecF
LGVDGVDVDGGVDGVDAMDTSGIDDDLNEALGAEGNGDVGTEDLTPGLSDDELITVDDAARSLIRQRERKRERHGPFARLFRGETRFDFVGRRRIWFALSTLIILAGVVSIVLRGGLNLGIEFKGGTEWTVKAPGITQVQAVDAMQAAGLSSPIVQLLGQGSNQHLNVQADLNKLSAKAQTAESLKVDQAIARLTHTTVENVENGIQTVGPTWGSSITNKAIEALIIFFVVVGIYISIRFEPKMALAAFLAMLHDVLVAVGVYSIFNFQVTPDTVVAILTILGYSLYDTVVVFDRVRDNTKGIGSSGRISYPQLINLSMNQTLARSINTSLVAILPVLAVLTVGAEILGATTLQDYGLALFVGLLSGAYSSIFIASPVLSMLKSREPRWLAIEQRVASRGDRDGAYSAASAAALSNQLSISAGGQPARTGRSAPAKRTGPIRPGSGTAGLDRPAGGTGAGGGAAGAPRPSGSGGGTAAPRPRKGKGKRKR